ncbi:glycosyltransferase [Streptomyces bohaiensis]|uniref:Glycosyltransferase family 1 protein n=1 Tax=Streptomyces bohaiensis TaxID=1431344 RepID=A0ABX1C7Z7_9ACTN|nr:glycosyltransferase [Streptomyces bohaiensis]NJQ15272.1 glycosyltransferase family 1 protein [Streptomyces bohaiensis]
MRVLCTVTGTPSHARAMLPLVRALSGAGHEVLVVAPPGPARVFAHEKATVRVEFAELSDQVMGALMDGRATLPPDLDLHDQRLWMLPACGPHLSDNYRLLLPIAREFAPHLLLRDGTDFAGFLVAETLGVVQVPAPSGTGQYLDPELVTGALAERRDELGLPADDDPLAIYRHGRLDCVPASLSYARPGLPDAFAYQQSPVVTRAQRLPEWMAELPADRPLVIAATGTLLTDFTPEEGTLPEAATDNPLSHVPEAYIAGLSEIDCTAIVATAGIPVDPTLAGDNVHVVDHFPQPELLQCAQLFLTHGGYNSIRESLRAGVPMAVLPLFGDQEHNANRTAELGVGLRVMDADAENVTKTCDRLVGDAAATAGARAAQRRMMTLPPVEAAVDHLEGLVG